MTKVYLEFLEFVWITLGFQQYYHPVKIKLGTNVPKSNQIRQNFVCVQMGMAINCHEKLQHLEFALVSLVVLNRNTERVAELPALGRICSIAPYCWFPIWIATKVMVTQALPWEMVWCIAVLMGTLRSPFLTLPTTACCFLAASVVYIFDATHGFIATCCGGCDGTHTDK